jgi:predicted MPP superfamily phosphohydrolase
MWNRIPDIEAAIANADTDDFILLISHNPDVTIAQSTTGIDLILAGHTHNGQIAFFGIALYLLRGSITSYGMRFGHGFADSKDGVPVFTSSGVGDYYTVPRIFARPEVVIFTMRNTE